MEGAVTALLCRTSDRIATTAEGARALAEALAARMRRRGPGGRHARRAGGNALRRRPARRPRLPAGGRRPGRGRARRRALPGPHLLGLLDLHHHAAGRRATAPRGVGAVARRAPRLQRPRDDAVGLPAVACACRRRAGRGTPGSTAGTSILRAWSCAASATSTPASGSSSRPTASAWSSARRGWPSCSPTARSSCTSTSTSSTRGSCPGCTGRSRAASATAACARCWPRWPRRAEVIGVEVTDFPAPALARRVATIVEPLLP